MNQPEIGFEPMTDGLRESSEFLTTHKTVALPLSYTGIKMVGRVRFERTGLKLTIGLQPILAPYESIYPKIGAE